MTTRKPRKMPKNQRAYPKKGKPRMTQVFEPEWTLLRMAQGDIGVPTAVLDPKVTSHGWANADHMRKWRALRNPPTSEAKHGT